MKLFQRREMTLKNLFLMSPMDSARHGENSADFTPHPSNSITRLLITSERVGGELKNGI